MIGRLVTWLRVKDHRSRIYGYAGVVGTLAVAAGWITQGSESSLLVSIGAVLGLGGTGLAKAHTPTKRAAARKARRAAKKKG